MKFKNLFIEMTRLGLTTKELANLTRIKYQTLSKKLSGEKEFRLGDIVKIRNVINPRLELDYLFAE